MVRRYFFQRIQTKEKRINKKKNLYNSNTKINIIYMSVCMQILYIHKYDSCI